MNLAVILRNIELRLLVKRMSADQASRESGHPDAIRNLRRKVAGKLKGSFTVRTLEDIARVLGCDAEDLMRDENPLQMKPVKGLREALIEQRDLIDRQIAELDQAEFTAQKVQKRKYR